MATGVGVRAIVLSRFALDGGAMHGIVPKVLWERVHPADAKNRIALVARALVVDDDRAGARTVIELGMGQAWSDKERERSALDDGDDAPDVLKANGIDPETVTHVVLTHLHWDHAGGVVRRDGSTLAFPKAEHVVAARALAHALAPNAKDAGSFRASDLEALVKRAKLRAVDIGDRLAPSIDSMAIDGGHTEGQLVPIVRARDDGPPIAAPTDLVPTRSHLKVNWVMAYDDAPAATIEAKRSLFAELARIGGGVALYHDPVAIAAWPNGDDFVPGDLGG